MRRTIWCAAMAMAGSMAGCGGAPPKPPAAAEKPPVTKAEPKPTPKVEAKPVEVKPDEFPSVDAALAAIDQALALPEGAEQNRALLRCEKWLVLQKEKAVAPLAARAGDAKAPLPARLTAARIVSQCGPAAVAPLMDLAKSSESAPVRRRAIDMLARFKPTPPEVLAMHLAFLEGPDAERIRLACEQLEKIGEPAKSAAKKLSDLRENHRDEAVRRAAGDALKKVSPRRTFTDK